jgi:hypothetical protein
MSADVKRKGAFMNKKLVFLAMLVSLLAPGFILTGCPTDSGGGDETGTFRIKITDIPADVMAAGQILIGLYPANTTNYAPSNALAGRDTSQSGDDDRGSDWYEFSMYNVTPGTKYTGSAGNYDIAFTGGSVASKVLKNIRLEVNQTNTVSYNAFVTETETGTFRIRITDIPPDVMIAGQNGDILIGLYPANTTTYTVSNALAGRDTSQYGNDDIGSDWYEFYMYEMTPGSKYTGSAGNYDIAFSSPVASKVLKNKRLEVNQTNTVSYNDFQNP